ncbi:putative replication origin binding protein [Vibrio phage VCPH]|nr:putative replication origin binding protein [Vibrio phage VCPH]
MFVILSPYIGEHPTSRGVPFSVDSKDGCHFVKTFSNKNPEGDPPKLVTLFDIEEQVEPINLQQTLLMVNKYRNRHYNFAIRYVPTTAAAEKAVGIRRVSDNFQTPKPSPILFMDIDSLPFPDGLEWHDVEGQGHYVCSVLHKEFPDLFPENMSFIAKASGSSGIKRGNIRLHLYLENKFFISTEQMAHLVYTVINEKHEDLIDPAPYHPRQPHYIADPSFLDDQKDPFKSNGHDRVAYYFKGNMAEIPANTPAYVSRSTVTLSDEHNRFLERTNGECMFSERVAGYLADLEEREDTMFTRGVPRLYHMAWEDGVCLDFLEKAPTEREQEEHGIFLYTILSKYPKVVEGTRCIQDYFNNGRKACLTKIVGEARRDIPVSIDSAVTSQEMVDYSTDVPDNLRSGRWGNTTQIARIESDSKLHDQYLKVSNVPPANTLTFIKASLGTGKTTAVKLWLARGEVQGRFLAITNTRALVDSNARIFGAPENEAYRKIKFHNEYYNDPDGRMSTTIHSIHRYKEMAELGMIDFVFIDEADAVMNELLNSTLMRERQKCMDTLGELLSSAKNVVLSDGDISEETIKAYHGLCKVQKPVNVIEHKREMLKGASAYELGDPESIWSITSASLSHGDKVLVVTDLGPDDLNIRQMALSNLHPGKVIKQIHSNSSNDEDIREILKYTNEALKKQEIDGLLCSPSVTNGVDFRYFDTVCVITMSGLQPPNLRFQAIRRDRGAKEIYYYTDSKTKGFMSGYTLDMAQKSASWLERNQIHYGLRRTRESARFPSTLRYYLLDQGAQVEVMKEKWEPLNYEEAKAAYDEERTNAIVMATEAYQARRHNDAWEAKNEVVKYYELDSTSEVCEHTAGLYVKEKPNKKMAFLNQIVRAKLWPKILECEWTAKPFVRFLDQKGHVFYQATGLSAKPILANMYLKQMGIEYDEDTGQANFEKIKRWYRAYCIMQEIDIPKDFMTEEELLLSDESFNDISMGRNKPIKLPKPVSISGNGLAWGNCKKDPETTTETPVKATPKPTGKGSTAKIPVSGLAWGAAKGE